MADKSNAKPRSRFLSRLLRDQRGNTIAIMAAAVIPVLGLVGGSVDMGRIYLVKTRLQAACDAGALMGRKVMGAGTWNSTANSRAREMFATNFQDGSYGSTGLNYAYTETGGDVMGTATAAVPVTLMRPVMLNYEARAYVDAIEASQNRTVSANERQAIYKQLDADKTGATRDKVVTVNCNAEQVIPNTDVMFVLDVTGSMSGPASSSSSESRISGLKKATKCFFESLAKENIDDVTPAECGRSTDPTTGIGSDISLRFGFVPYSVNANVGKLLPLNYMADSWTYQSREADWSETTGYRAIYGTESGYTPSGSPTTSSGTGWGGWDDATANVTIGGYTYDYRFRATSSECAAVSAPPAQTGTSTGSYTFVSQTPTTPTYPTDTAITKTYSRTTTNGETEYRYVHSSNRCRLQYRTRTTGSTTNYFQTTTPITWVPNRTFEGWDYKPVTFDISGLKNTASNAWNNSVSLPLGTQGAMTSVTWTGCIEERQTKRVLAADPSASWNPIPTDAYDMQIDLLPDSNQYTKWAPIFNNVVYRRYLNSNRTTAMVESDGSGTWLNGGSASQSNATCPIAAKKYQTWSPTNFKNYVNSLSTGGNTYHDIGLLWGARLMSPQGIFAAENAMTDMVVDRHLIFMTDGQTNMQLDDYSAYGINWWDRRQNDGADPTKTWLDDNLDARTQAICKAVRDKNINVWVVAFGDDIDAATETNLQNCASSGKYFRAVSVADIITQFNSIASQIAALRLTE